MERLEGPKPERTVLCPAGSSELLDSWQSAARSNINPALRAGSSIWLGVKPSNNLGLLSASGESEPTVVDEGSRPPRRGRCGCPRRRGCTPVLRVLSQTGGPDTSTTAPVGTEHPLAGGSSSARSKRRSSTDQWGGPRWWSGRSRRPAAGSVRGIVVDENLLNLLSGLFAGLRVGGEDLIANGPGRWADPSAMSTSVAPENRARLCRGLATSSTKRVPLFAATPVATTISASGAPWPTLPAATREPRQHGLGVGVEAPTQFSRRAGTRADAVPTPSSTGGGGYGGWEKPPPPTPGAGLQDPGRSSRPITSTGRKDLVDLPHECSGLGGREA